MNTIRKYMNFGVAFAVAACCILGVIVQSTPQQTAIIAKPTMTALPTYTPSPESTAEPTVDKEAACKEEMVVFWDDIQSMDKYLTDADKAYQANDFVTFKSSVQEAKKLHDAMSVPTCYKFARTVEQLYYYTIKHLGEVVDLWKNKNARTQKWNEAQSTYIQVDNYKVLILDKYINR